MTDLKSDGQAQVRSLSQYHVPGDYYTHYKGGVYVVVTLAVDENTGTPLIVYKSCKYGTIWVRTLTNFTEMVDLPSGKVQRFTKGAP